jgi:hypothetical protein
MPLLVLPIIALQFDSSWEVQIGSHFWPLYIFESCISIAMSILLLLWSARFSKSLSAGLRARRKLIDQAASSQSLLETVMPCAFAQALLAGTPAFLLAADHDNSFVAFILLHDFEALAMQLEPEALLAWLNNVYAAFDALVDVFPSELQKIE